MPASGPGAVKAYRDVSGSAGSQAMAAQRERILRIRRRSGPQGVGGQVDRLAERPVDRGDVAGGLIADGELVIADGLMATARAVKFRPVRASEQPRACVGRFGPEALVPRQAVRAVGIAGEERDRPYLNAADPEVRLASRQISGPNARQQPGR